MNDAAKNILQIAKMLANREIELTCLRVKTPDGRGWEIVVVPAGRGRHLDGHWGPRPGARGGFRLFELDRECENIGDEHDCTDYDCWDAGNLADYLDAVGTNNLVR